MRPCKKNDLKFVVRYFFGIPTQTREIASLLSEADFHQFESSHRRSNNDDDTDDDDDVAADTIDDDGWPR